MMDINMEMLQQFIIFFDEKSALRARLGALATRVTSTSSSGSKNANTSNQELAEELHK